MLAKNQMRQLCKVRILFFVCVLLMSTSCDNRDHKIKIGPVCIEKKVEFAKSTENPLIRLSDTGTVAQFEAYIKQRPELVNYTRKKYPKAEDDCPCSPLSACAYLFRTNHAEILIKYGADIEEAIAFHKKEKNDEYVDFLMRLKR